MDIEELMWNNINYLNGVLWHYRQFAIDLNLILASAVNAVLWKKGNIICLLLLFLMFFLSLFLG